MPKARHFTVFIADTAGKTMNRFEKKCLLGSMLGHGLLLAVMLVCMAFKTGEEVESTPQVLTLFNISDGPSRGGNPNVAVAAKPVIQPQPAPQEAPPQPVQETPKVVQREPEPEPEKPKPQVEPVKALPKADIPIQKPKKAAEKVVDLKPITRGQTASNNEKPKLVLKPVVRNGSDSKVPSAKPSQAKDRRQNSELASGFSGAVASIRRNNNTVTSIDVEAGPGGDGPAMSNYRDLVGRIYQNNYDSALLTARDIEEGAASVDVSVTIDRSGRVVNSRIVRGSGNAALDRLVRKVLDRVDSIGAAFPSTAKEAQRSFNLTFDLAAKRLAG
jgi:protein TonB